MIYLSENLVKARKRLRWSQRAVALMTGIKRCTYAAYEENRATPPNDLLIDLCIVFGIESIHDFVFNKDFCMCGNYTSIVPKLSLPKSLVI